MLYRCQSMIAGHPAVSSCWDKIGSTVAYSDRYM